MYKVDDTKTNDFVKNHDFQSWVELAAYGPTMKFESNPHCPYPIQKYPDIPQVFPHEFWANQ